MRLSFGKGGGSLFGKGGKDDEEPQAAEAQGMSTTPSALKFGGGGLFSKLSNGANSDQTTGADKSYADAAPTMKFGAGGGGGGFFQKKSLGGGGLFGGGGSSSNFGGGGAIFGKDPKSSGGGADESEKDQQGGLSFMNRAKLFQKPPAPGSPSQQKPQQNDAPTLPFVAKPAVDQTKERVEKPAESAPTVQLAVDKENVAPQTDIPKPFDDKRDGAESINPPVRSEEDILMNSSALGSEAQPEECEAESRRSVSEEEHVPSDSPENPMDDVPEQHDQTAMSEDLGMFAHAGQFGIEKSFCSSVKTARPRDIARAVEKKCSDGFELIQKQRNKAEEMREVVRGMLERVQALAEQLSLRAVETVRLKADILLIRDHELEDELRTIAEQFQQQLECSASQEGYEQPFDSQMEQPFDSQMGQPFDSQMGQPFDLQMEQPFDLQMEQPFDSQMENMMPSEPIEGREAVEVV
uniref:Uncharacterized protein n=1 Tax=Chromera velia CCMP2878 TaxID=1169474 RepID=A0A0G4HY21_9ALVE|eukprot:Cvel_1511.t1-p1 / transcript=Cvel_1511.t1 / gene=Cvel_1511 / organism=Chromera_velia_CCMP2878 / gene_product=hypothetical protein / transcript_product=hypothetical protein / location=Cvel_scaffold53:75848-77764(+) / protein_length=465 / sequence_SO=supercontig / SO=protein_coding / is_pseudo=false